jgi:hypothetical protein
MGNHPDEVAVVVDNHSGKVYAHFIGIGAKGDAIETVRECKGKKIEGMQQLSVVTGAEATKALKNGRV